MSPCLALTQTQTTLISKVKDSSQRRMMFFRNIPTLPFDSHLYFRPDTATDLYERKKKPFRVRDSRDHMRAHENFIIIIIIITKQKRRYTRGFCWCKKKELRIEHTEKNERTGNIINRHHQTSVRSWRGEHRRRTFERLRQQRELNTPDIQSVSSSF